MDSSSSSNTDLPPSALSLHESGGGSNLQSGVGAESMPPNENIPPSALGSGGGDFINQQDSSSSSSQQPPRPESDQQDPGVLELMHNEEGGPVQLLQQQQAKQGLESPAVAMGSGSTPGLNRGEGCCDDLTAGNPPAGGGGGSSASSGDSSPPPSLPEGARELSSEVIVGTLKIRVGIRKPATSLAWPRWAVQCLDVDGSELIIDTMDISQPFVPCPRDNKAVTLTRDPSNVGGMYDGPGGVPGPLAVPPAPGGECDCPECKNEQRMMMGDDSGGGGMGGDSVMKRRRYDGPDDDVMSDDGGPSSCMRGGRDHMAGGPPPPGYHGGPVVYAPPPPNSSVECDDPSMVPYMHPQNPRGPSSRIYTEEEKRKLRNVNWPKKIKTNGLPALWCHSCYLDKRMFKIVSPLSPKPSIVYFRHQQCNTSYHKGESLPAHIVKQYQEYYRNRGNRQAAAAAAGQPPQPSLTPPPTRVAPPNYGGAGSEASTSADRRRGGSGRRDSAEGSSEGGGGSSSGDETSGNNTAERAKDNNSMYGSSNRRQLLG